jgi:hypothetical protein
MELTRRGKGENGNAGKKQKRREAEESIGSINGLM